MRYSIYRYQQPSVDLIGWALGHVALSGAERVLDVGCGPGRYLQRLGRRSGLRLIGVDLSIGMLRDLLRNWNAELSRPAVATADVQALPLPDASCDLALAMHMLYHVPDIERALRELRRVLRPGATLLAATNSVEHTREIDQVIMAAIAARSGQTPPSFSKDRFTLENGAAILQRAFEHVERHDAPATLVIPEAPPVLAYVDSMRSMIEKLLPGGASWEKLLAEVDRIVATIITKQGAFRVRTHAGVFVCR